MGANRKKVIDYAKVSHGALRIKSDKSNPGAVMRKVTDKEGNETGKIVYEIVYNSWTGLITNVRFNKHDQYGWSVNVYMEDGLEKICIQVSAGNNNYRSLLMRIEEIDYSRKVEFMPWKMTGTDGRDRMGIALRYDDNAVGEDKEKVPSHYSDSVKTETGFKTTYKNGLPTLEGEFDQDKWEIKSREIDIFLREKVSYFTSIQFTQDDTTESSDSRPAQSAAAEHDPNFGAKNTGDGGETDDIPF